MLAKAEAELIQSGGVRFMNKEMTGLFSERSVEAIKKKRQSQPYKLMLKNLLEALAGPSSNALPPLSAEQRTLPSHSAQDEVEGIDVVPPTAGPPVSSHSTGSQAMPECDLLIPIVAFRGPYRTEEQELDVLTWAMLKELPPSNGVYSAVDIILKLNKDSPKEVFLGHLATVFESAVREVTSSEAQKRKRNLRSAIHSNQLTRRQECKRNQNLYGKNRGQCYNAIINGSLGSEFRVTQAFAQDFWVNTMTPGKCSLPALPARRTSPSPEVKVATLWGPIPYEEIQSENISQSAQLRKLPWEFLCKILNLFLWCRRVPASLLAARTVFIPKCVSPTSPGELRPFSIGNVLVKLFHKILANRLRASIKLDPHQKGFAPLDSMMENTTVLDFLLSKFYTERRELHIASIDFQKAFDSISQEALLKALEDLHLPKVFINYVEDVYKNSYTTLEFNDGLHTTIHPTVGVRQGDPLSPLFNIALDVFLRSLSVNIGVQVDGSRLNAVAFADDVILFASTARGLQELLNCSNMSLGALGLRINFLKSFTLSLVQSGRDKKTNITSGSFRVGNTPIPHLGVDTEWTYLGVLFTPTGKSKVKILEHIRPKLEVLTKAPLKPQQRLFFLRCHILPSVYRCLSPTQWALGRAGPSSLKKADTMVRGFIRKWLDLPVDTPVPFYYADVEDGGLGVPCLRSSGVRLRLDRLNYFKMVLAFR
ncbi:Retrovirus-related Pol polyprotein type-2 like protein [Argiope bruennichi]|uniref:Retrovirus-related Pol polyprotein type-2 like protein n=1 Tax=Argiope bruennichi TaxID=94029 RepID=A0A8T0FSV9_ARGBR|nr:Retrovirus-related Pol polyprotein type-2 like protein [Argiope bruennichi]